MGRPRKKDETPLEQPAAEVEPAAAAPAEVAEEPATEEPPVEEQPPAKPARRAAAPKEKPAERKAAKEKPAERKAAKPAARRKPAAAAKRAERKPIVRLPKPEHERGQRKERRGVVVSSAMDKTIVVRVETAKPHPRYKKIVRRSQRFHAHDEGNVANVGDLVRIVETRPLSKTKSWRLVEVVEAAR